MKIKFNGEVHDVESHTLARLVNELGLGKALIATAVNGVFVPAIARDLTVLRTGDAIEVVAPLQGG